KIGSTKSSVAGCQLGSVRASADVRRIARIHVAHTEDVAMRTYDFTPLWRSSVGFDRVFDLLNNNSRLLEGQGDWPRYDIARTGDDTYRITLALAGFSLDEISITAQQNLLTVSSEKAQALTQE